VKIVEDNVSSATHLEDLKVGDVCVDEYNRLLLVVDGPGVLNHSCGSVSCLLLRDDTVHNYTGSMIVRRVRAAVHKEEL